MNVTQYKHLISFKFILAVLCFYSCNSKTEATFEITNSTDYTIDNLEILPDENKNHKLSLAPHSKAIFKTNMTNIPKVDGSYFLTFNLGQSKRVQAFGYYTNGYPLEKITTINILKDTILFNSEKHKP